MKGKKEDKELRELFRQKLGNAEIVPSPETGMELMRKLGRREFLRFNPARFNIWYAGSIIIAGAAVAFMLSSEHEKRSLLIPFVEKKESVIQTDTVTVSSPDLNTQHKSVEADIKTSVAKSVKKTSPAGTLHPKTEKAVADNISPAGLAEKDESKKIFNYNTAEDARLRGKNYQGITLIKATPVEGCSPLKVKFHNLAAVFDSCRWTFGDGGYSSSRDAEWLFDIPGEYKIVLTVYGPGTSTVTSVETVKVNPRPVARFEMSDGNGNNQYAGVSFINYSADAVKYRWDFGDGSSSDQFEPKHSYKKSGSFNIKLVAISEAGCKDSLMIINAFSTAGFFINFPNAFIPNADGPSGGYYTPKSDEASQVFHPVSAGVSEYQLRIFSKRGILIFESNDINIGWDGYYKGQLSEPGVYIWKVRGYFTNGESFTKMGDVTLLKN